MTTKTKTKSETDSTPTAMVPREGKDILMSEESTVYLLDISGSMNQTLGEYDGEHISKQEALKKAVRAMFEARMTYATADKVSVVTFGNAEWSQYKAQEVVALSPVGPSHLNALTYRSDGGTPMFQGFEKAATVLAEAEGLVRIVLISDGEPNDYQPPSGKTVKEAIIDLVGEFSSNYGFVVDTVGVGIKGGSEYDEEFMKTVAAKGSGNFFPIDDVDSLIKLLTETALERRKYLGSGMKLLGDGLAVQ